MCKRQPTNTNPDPEPGLRKLHAIVYGLQGVEGKCQRKAYALLGYYHVKIEVADDEAELQSTIFSYGESYGRMTVQMRQVERKNLHKLTNSVQPNGFKCRIPIGQTRLSKAEVERVALELANSGFDTENFDRFSNNCGTFANKFAKRLTTDGKGLPKWINRATEAHPKNWLRRIKHYWQKKKDNGSQNQNEHVHANANEESVFHQRLKEKPEDLSRKKCDDIKYDYKFSEDGKVIFRQGWT
jgi:PPPDE putative peptidase domain